MKEPTRICDAGESGYRDRRNALADYGGSQSFHAPVRDVGQGIVRISVSPTIAQDTETACSHASLVHLAGTDSESSEWIVGIPDEGTYLAAVAGLSTSQW